MNKKKKRTIVIISIALLLLIGISYALLRKTIYGESGKIILHGGEIDVILEEDSIPDLALKSVIPTKDEDGIKSEDVYRFSVVNNSNTDVTYKIYLDNDEDAISSCENCGLLEDKDVKYELRKGESSSINTLETREIGEGRVNKNKKDTYELRLWLNIDAGNDAMGKKFFGKIRVEVVQTLEKEPEEEPKEETAVEKLLAEYTNAAILQDYQTSTEAQQKNMYVFTHEAGEQQSNYTSEELTDYRYIGINPNNYVTFNEEMWRIIGIFTVEDENGKKEKRIKLIRDEPLNSLNEPTYLSWDNKPDGTGSSDSFYGSNWWGDSRLMMVLNPGYETNSLLISGTKGSLYWNRQSGKCPLVDPLGKSEGTTDCNFTSTGLTSTAQGMIGDTKWYLGGLDLNETSVSELYQNERGKTAYGVNAIANTTRGISWTGKVGLMYPSDYGYATSGGTSETRDYCMSDMNGNGVVNWSIESELGTECIKGDWLFKQEYYDEGYSEWLIAPDLDYSNDVIFLYYDGYLDDVSDFGYDYAHDIGDMIVRPSVYLVSNIKLKSGTGSQSDPFVFEQ